jgi:Ca-activated chloride channel family protein
MFKLGNPNYIYLLAAAMFMLLAYIRARRRMVSRLNQAVDPTLQGTVSPAQRGWREVLESGFIIFSAALLAGAAAWPMVGSGSRLAKAAGVDVVVAIDVSKSMLARDVTPSRLERAKLEVRDFLKKIGGDRVGLVVFAGEAFIQCPLTTDHEAATVFLRSVEPGSVPQPGTSIKKAIAKAREMLRHVPEGAKTRLLVLITDGEDHEGEAVEEARAAAEEGVTIFTIGIGSASGEPVPELDEGGAMTGYKKDKAGNTVLSKLDESLLKQVASSSGGLYVHARDNDLGMDTVRAAMEKMAKTETQSRVIIEYVERFKWLLVPGTFLLVVGALLPLTAGIKRRKSGS